MKKMLIVAAALALALGASAAEDAKPAPEAGMKDKCAKMMEGKNMPMDGAQQDGKPMPMHEGMMKEGKMKDGMECPHGKKKVRAKAKPLHDHGKVHKTS